MYCFAIDQHRYMKIQPKQQTSVGGSGGYLQSLWGLFPGASC